MKIKQIVASALVFALCGAPELVQAQSQTAPATATSNAQPAAPATAGNEAQAQRLSTPAANGPQTKGVTVDPSQGPLQPVPAETPLPPDSIEPAGAAQASPAGSNSKPQAQPAQTETQNLPANPAPQTPSEPVGAAAAQKGRAAGGAASKPAGTAIAPAKQGQVRSWLIRIGAIAAAGAALGTVYALSRKSPSIPPGAPTLALH